MKKTALLTALVALASVLVLSSCDAMFNTNLFKAAGLGQFELKNVDLTSASSIQDAAASSPTEFYSQMSADPASRDQAVATLMVPSASPSDLVLAAAIQINTTDAGALVDNIASQLPTLMSNTASPDIATVIGNIISDPAFSNIDLSSPTPPQAFTDMINAFSLASFTFAGIAVPGATLPAIPGGTSQDTAYMGLVSLAVAAVELPFGSPYSTVADALWALVSGQTTDSSIVTFNSASFNMNDTNSAAYVLLLDAGIDPASFR